MESDYLEENYYDSVGGDEQRVPEGVEVAHQSTAADQATVLQKRAQYAEELKQVEEEIQTLKQVLNAKYHRQHFLKQQLGITVISELREEVSKGMDTLRTTEAYQRTTAAVKTAKEKTSAALHEKWNVLKQTNAFKSFEDRLGMAYSSVRPVIGKEFSKNPPAEHGSIASKPSTTVTDSNTTSAGSSSSLSTNNTAPTPTLNPAKPTGGAIQLGQITLDDHESDETEEFVQPIKSKSSSKRRHKQKPNTFAD